MPRSWTIGQNTGVSLPRRLGRLQQVSRIGVGGFATVWLYHDEELDSPVAVKALADNWAQRADVRERFLEEGRILRRADADHVVRVYDIGETDDGTPYFVMTYADRGTVADLLAKGTPSVEETVRLVGQAGLGISVLHRLGVVHRDVKPQNLLLQSVGDGETRLLVADLGVAKALLHASGITQVVGTPAYMAPEQAWPGAGVDTRADVHALAAVAYQLFTGRQAREGGLGDLMAARMPQPPTVYTELPLALNDVLLKGLHPEREKRWPDVDSFVHALEGAATGRPVHLNHAWPVTVREPEPGRWSGMRGWRLGVLAVVVLMVAFLAGYLAMSGLQG
ncbi:MAG: protein kinase [Propionibacteriales bacterium]|nr:protein kinase [Propionibacteriales bacterium]